MEECLLYRAFKYSMPRILLGAERKMCIRDRKEGIQVEKEALRVYGETLQVQIERLEIEIYELSGETFNINSPKQLGVILFEKLKLPYGKKTKTGYSTSADILEKLAPEDVYKRQPMILEF